MYVNKHFIVNKRLQSIIMNVNFKRWYFQIENKKKIGWDENSSYFQRINFADTNIDLGWGSAFLIMKLHFSECYGIVPSDCILRSESLF